MPKVLIINLSDEKGSGKQAADSLEQKYGQSNVELRQLSAQAQEWKKNPEKIDLSLPDIQNYEQIIIAAHGDIGDTKTCYYENFETAEEIPLFSPQQCAQFFNEILTQSNQPLEKNIPVTLAICYAARTEDYKLDHVSNPENIPYLKTFAGQFLTTLHENSSMKYNIDLTAYTGSVGFNSKSGELEVETEEHIQKSGEIAHLREAYAKAQSYMDFCVNQVEEKMREEDYSDSQINKYLDYYFDNKVFLVEDSTLGKACKDSFRLQTELTQELSKAAVLEEGYGKVTFIAQKNNPDLLYDTSEIQGKNFKNLSEEKEENPNESSGCSIM